MNGCSNIFFISEIICSFGRELYVLRIYYAADGIDGA